MTDAMKLILLQGARHRAQAAEPGSWVCFENGAAFLREWVIKQVDHLTAEYGRKDHQPKRPRGWQFDDTLDALNHAINWGTPRPPSEADDLDFSDVHRFADLAAKRAAAAKRRGSGFNTSSDTWKHRQGVDEDGQEVVLQHPGEKTKNVFRRTQGEFQW